MFGAPGALDPAAVAAPALLVALLRCRLARGGGRSLDAWLGCTGVPGLSGSYLWCKDHVVVKVLVWLKSSCQSSQCKQAFTLSRASHG